VHQVVRDLAGTVLSSQHLGHRCTMSMIQTWKSVHLYYPTTEPLVFNQDSLDRLILIYSIEKCSDEGIDKVLNVDYNQSRVHNAIESLSLFNGQCETAFKFYEKCLGGKITTMMTYGESPESSMTIR